MTQGILPFKYETEKNTTGMTALAGLPVYLDLDATLVATNKTDALFCYKGYKAYQPLNTWWFEQGIVLHIYKTAYGKRYKTGVEWAEVCYVPNAIGYSEKGPEYRYLAKREVLDKQQALPGMDRQIELPFPTMDIKSQRYKVFGMVTNMNWEGEKLIHWLHERCGKSEEAHAVMKDDLAGGKLPSEDFGENAAWWWIMNIMNS